MGKFSQHEAYDKHVYNAYCQVRRGSAVLINVPDSDVRGVCR